MRFLSAERQRRCESAVVLLAQVAALAAIAAAPALVVLAYRAAW